MPGSKSWDSAITRIVIWVLLKDIKTNQKFYVFNTHFDHRGEKARIESAKIVTEHISELSKDVPIVLTGDFNASESSEVYSVLTDHFRDARYISKSGHKGPNVSFSNWKELRGESRIDYIFVNDNIHVQKHSILDDRFDNRFPSDHLPVFTKLCDSISN